MEILEKTKENVKQTHKQILAQTLGMMSSAFVLVAALAWNEAIKGLITKYLSSGNGLISQFSYAILVTVLAVIVTMKLNKLAQKFKDNDAK